MEKLNKKFVPAVLIVAVLAVVWYMDHGDSGRQQEIMPELFESAATMPPEPAAADGKVYIHIVGAVKKPGVYSFDSSPRVVEVVEQAGGFTKDAVRSGVNQAQRVEDGSQIVIESRDGKKKQAAAGRERTETQRSAQGESGRININRATKEELMTLPGIGESKAVSIISYRDTNGTFKKIEDIMNITGIKTGVFDKIRDRIEV